MAAEPTNGTGEPRARQDGAERPLGDPRRRLGARGERLAREHLEARGFEIVEANFRTRHGELDLVGRNERFLVFCEVKTRISKRGPRPLGPLSAIGPRKQRRLRLMAREWLAARKLQGLRPREIRFDAIGVEIDPSGRLVGLEHLEGAF